MRMRGTDKIRRSGREENERKMESKSEWETAETRSCGVDIWRGAKAVRSQCQTAERL